VPAPIVTGNKNEAAINAIIAGCLRKRTEDRYAPEQISSPISDLLAGQVRENRGRRGSQVMSGPDLFVLLCCRSTRGYSIIERGSRRCRGAPISPRTRTVGGSCTVHAGGRSPCGSCAVHICHGSAVHRRHRSPGECRGCSLIISRDG